MPVLNCPIPKKDWQREVSERNADSTSPVRHAVANPAEDAGAWESTIQKLAEFQQLGDDWDGLGARTPSKELLISAIGLAQLFAERGVAPPHAVVPGLDGTVLFEWQFPDGAYAEIEIVRPLYAEAMLIESGRPTRHWTLPTE